MNPNSCCSQFGGRCMTTEEVLYLNYLREKNLLCDAVLRLQDGGVFHVHRPFLSACSTYFRFVWLLMWLINV
jgi:kelch-like protein 10